MLSTLPLVFFMKVKLLIPLKGTTTYFSRKMQNRMSLWQTQLQIFSLRLSVSSLFKLVSKTEQREMANFNQELMSGELQRNI